MYRGRSSRVRLRTVPRANGHGYLQFLPTGLGSLDADQGSPAVWENVTLGIDLRADRDGLHAGAANNVFISRWRTAATENKCWFFGMGSANQLKFWFSEDGTTANSHDHFQIVPTTRGRQQVRVKLTFTGGLNYSVEFFTRVSSDDITESAGWVQVGSTQNGTCNVAAVIHDGNTGGEVWPYINAYQASATPGAPGMPGAWAGNLYQVAVLNHTGAVVSYSDYRSGDWSDLDTGHADAQSITWVANDTEFTDWQHVPGFQIGAVSDVSTDPMGVTDVAVRTATASRALSSPGGLSDSSAVANSYSRSQVDGAGVSDSIVIDHTSNVVLTDVVGATDVASPSSSYAVTETNNLGLGDERIVTSGYATSLVDALDLADSALFVESENVTLVSTEGVTDNLSVVQSHAREISDSASMTDFQGKVSDSPRNIIDNSGQTDFATVAKTDTRSLTDIGSLSDNLQIVPSLQRPVTDAQDLSDQLVTATNYAVTITEDVALTSVTDVQETEVESVTLIDLSDLTDDHLVTVSHVRSLTDSAALTDQVNAQEGESQLFVDPIGSTDQLVTATNYAVTITEDVALTSVTDVQETEVESVTLIDLSDLTDDQLIDVTYARLLIDGTSLADQIITDESETQVFADPLGIIDVITTATNYAVTITDASGAVDDSTADKSGLSSRTINNDGDLADDTQVIVSSERAQSSVVGVTDDPVVVATYSVTFTDAVGFTDQMTEEETEAVNEVFTDTVGVLDSSQPVITYERSLTDVAALTDSTTVQEDGLDSVTITDGEGLTDTPQVIVTYAITYTSFLSSADTLDQTSVAERSETDTFGMVDDTSTSSGQVIPYSDPLALTDTVSIDEVKVFDLEISDSLGVSSSTIVQEDELDSRTYTDSTGVTDDPTWAASSVRSASDSIGVTDQVQANLTHAITVSDGLGTTETFARTAAVARTITESGEISDQLVIQPAGVQNVTINDTLAIIDVFSGGTSVFAIHLEGKEPPNALSGRGTLLTMSGREPGNSLSGKEAGWIRDL